MPKSKWAGRFNTHGNALSNSNSNAKCTGLSLRVYEAIKDKALKLRHDFDGAHQSCPDPDDGGTI
jgi:hypothetical protein